MSVAHPIAVTLYETLSLCRKFKVVPIVLVVVLVLVLEIERRATASRTRTSTRTRTNQRTSKIRFQQLSCEIKNFLFD